MPCKARVLVKLFRRRERRDECNHALQKFIAVGAHRWKSGSTETLTLRKNIVTAFANIPVYKFLSSIRGFL